MPYTPTTWTNEVPDTTPIKYKITQTTDGDIAPNAKIEVVTGVTAGTPVNATNMNKIETGIQTAQAAAEAAQTTANAAMPNPFTTVGDMVYRNSTVPARLAKPTDPGIFIMSGAGVPSYLQGGTANAGKLVRVKADGTWELAGFSTTTVKDTGNQSVSAGNPVLWAVEVYDDEGWHSTVSNTSRITVTAAGRYKPACVLGLWTPTGGATVPYIASLRINGTEKYVNRKAMYQDGTMHTMEFPSIAFDLTASQYVEIIYNTGGSINMDYSYFSLERVG